MKKNNKEQHNTFSRAATKEARANQRKAIISFYTKKRQEEKKR